MLMLRIYGLVEQMQGVLLRKQSIVVELLLRMQPVWLDGWCVVDGGCREMNLEIFDVYMLILRCRSCRCVA